MFMPQRTVLINGSMYDQISYPKIGCSDISVMDELINLVGLEKKKNRFQIKNWRDFLSPGEIQKLMFARVLYHKPEMVVMDETSNAIEVNSEKKLFFELWSRKIITVILRHDIDWLIDYCRLFIRLDGSGNIFFSSCPNPSISDDNIDKALLNLS